MSSKSEKKNFDAFKVEEIPKINFIERWRRRVRDAPENIRLASQSAWRGRERGRASAVVVQALPGGCSTM